MIDIHKPLHIHFIGIGGHQHERTGRDSSRRGFCHFRFLIPNPVLLRRHGEKGPPSITDSVPQTLPMTMLWYIPQLSILTTRMCLCKGKGLPMLTRAELLGQIMRNYDTPVNISSELHGKTNSRHSMVSHILSLQENLDPTISGEASFPGIGGNIRVGNFETFVTEACEYTNSFLSFFPEDQYYPEYGCRPSGFPLRILTISVIPSAALQSFFLLTVH